MRMTHKASPLLLCILVFALSNLPGCTGQVFFRPEEEVTPGQAEDIEFHVPDGGLHEITIELDCTTASGAGLRIFIPEKAVTPGE